jgi:hypothetical protein
VPLGRALLQRGRHGSARYFRMGCMRKFEKLRKPSNSTARFSPRALPNGKKIRKWKNSRRRFYECEY